MPGPRDLYDDGSGKGERESDRNRTMAEAKRVGDWHHSRKKMEALSSELAPKGESRSAL